MADPRLLVRRLSPTVRGGWRPDIGGRLVARALSAIVRRGLVRLRVEGAGNLPVSGPAVVAANHLSFFDSVLVMFALPRRVYALGKAEYTERRVTRWLFCGAGMIPVRRQRLGDLGAALEQARGTLEAGAVLAVFPEGTRSRDGRLHRGHCGVAHLALQTGAPLIPVGIIGTDQILPVGARLLRPFRTADTACRRADLAGGQRIHDQHEPSPAGDHRPADGRDPTPQRATLRRPLRPAAGAPRRHLTPARRRRLLDSSSA